MRQRRVEQLRIAKSISDPLLTPLEPQGIVGTGIRRGRLNAGHTQYCRPPAVSTECPRQSVKASRPAARKNAMVKRKLL
jgi:hypothetical protein